MKRNTMNALKQLVAVTAAFFGMMALAAPAAQAELTCEVSPAKVPITLSYHGAKLTISGTSAKNDDLIVKIATEPHDAMMKFKGKAGGLFWMKKGSMEFKNVPAVYLLNTTADLNRILPVSERNLHHIGYDALGKTATVENSAGESVDAKWFDEFIRFKEKEKVYNIQEGTVTRQHGENGNTFQVVVNWPYQAPPGTYNVELLAIRDGKVVEQAATTFEVDRVGITATLSKMAFDQASLYGIMAIVIAMASGFAVAAVFKGDGGSH